MIVLRNYGRMDLLAVRDRSTPRRRSTGTLAVSSPSSAARQRRDDERRARRPSLPPVPSIEVIATIQMSNDREIPRPDVGADGVYFTTWTHAGDLSGIRKLARSSYEQVWETPPLGLEPQWTTDTHLVCGRRTHDRVEVLDTADGRSLWNAKSQRGESWAWRDLIVTSPYEVKDIRFLNPQTGGCERTIGRPLPRLCHVSGDLALVCAARHDTGGGSTFTYKMDPFAVVDLQTGQLKWQRAILERFPSEEGSLRIAELLAVSSRVAVVWASRCIAGIDLTTDTGNVTSITGRAESPDPCEVWGDYAVSLTTGTLDLYHLDGTSMRLKLRNEARTAIEAPPDLILVERSRLRIVRQVPPVSGTVK